LPNVFQTSKFYRSEHLEKATKSNFGSSWMTIWICLIRW